MSGTAEAGAGAIAKTTMVVIYDDELLDTFTNGIRHQVPAPGDILSPLLPHPHPPTHIYKDTHRHNTQASDTSRAARNGGGNCAVAMAPDAHTQGTPGAHARTGVHSPWHTTQRHTLTYVGVVEQGGLHRLSTRSTPRLSALLSPAHSACAL